MTADRRELKRQYRESGPQAGIYAVRGDGLLVVGASADVNGALNRVRFELRLGRHRDRALQRQWNERGEAGLSFEVLDVLEPRDEPGFDLKAELAALAALWREELGPGPA